MVFFFYVVGLEIRRELSMGELTDKREAAIPALAALAGMAVPALVYVAFNLGTDAVKGWGIVMATDIAFVLGALALLGPRCPPPLRVFLLTLAIVDDIGAITVIAVFYSESIEVAYLLAAAGILGAILLLRPVRVWRGPAYFVAGLALWVAMLKSGRPPDHRGRAARDAHRRAPARAGGGGARGAGHPLLPAVPERLLGPLGAARGRRGALPERAAPGVDPSVDELRRSSRSSRSPTPGVGLSGNALSAAFGSAVTLGIIGGLVIGKLVGITLASLLGVRSGLGTLPRGVNTRHLMGGAALAGIGFTVSLFVTDLAFDDPAIQEEAKVGVLAASALAAAIGYAFFRWAGRAEEATPAVTVLTPPVDEARDHIRGSFSAPLTIVEYGDFECLFCGEAVAPIRELRERYGDELRYVFRHLPLRDVHPHAALAAQAAEAAGNQAAFWEMYDLLYAHQDQLELADVEGYAGEIGLDIERFVRDLLEERAGVQRVQEDVESAEASGVTGTPTFFVAGARASAASHDADSLAAALEASRGA